MSRKMIMLSVLGFAIMTHAALADRWYITFVSGTATKTVDLEMKFCDADLDPEDPIEPPVTLTVPAGTTGLEVRDMLFPPFGSPELQRVHLNGQPGVFSWDYGTEYVLKNFWARQAGGQWQLVEPGAPVTIAGLTWGVTHWGVNTSGVGTSAPAVGTLGVIVVGMAILGGGVMMRRRGPAAN